MNTNTLSSIQTSEASEIQGQGDISSPLSSPTKKKLDMEKSLELLLNKVNSQCEKKKMESAPQSNTKTLDPPPNSIYVSSNENQIVLNKRQLMEYMKSNTYNILNYLFSEDFSYYFYFIDSTAYLSQYNADGLEPLMNENIFSPCNPYIMDFTDQENETSVLFSKEKALLYSTNIPKVNLSFGDSPNHLYRRIIQNKRPNFEKELMKLENIASSLPRFIERYQGVFTYFNSNEETSSKCSFVEEGNYQESKYQEDYEFIRKKKGRRKFPCDFCPATFSSHQGLGGHMSRSHKDQSLKFKKKKEIRNSRTAARDLLEEAKKVLCENNKFNYDELISSKQGKIKLKKIILQHEKEYKKIRKELKENK